MDLSFNKNNIDTETTISLDSTQDHTKSTTWVIILISLSKPVLESLDFIVPIVCGAVLRPT